MTHALALIGAGLPKNDPESPELPTDIKQGICCVTGVMGDTVPRDEVISKSFTNLDLLQAPSSDRIGIDVYRAMKYKWQRMSCWHVAESFVRIDRVGVRDRVFGELPAVPWAGYATTSYKKHGGLLAPVNTGNQNRWLFELRIVDCTDRKLVNEWWSVMNKALRDGIGRNAMETLDMPYYNIKIIGMATWMEFEAWARPKLKTPLYAFLRYLLPSQEELKHESL